MTLMTDITDELVAQIVTATMRWSHRRHGGHSHRTIHAARAKARKALLRMGFTSPQVEQIIRDCGDLAALEINAAE